MVQLNRRVFLKLGAASASLVAMSGAVASGIELKEGGQDHTVDKDLGGKLIERQKIPSSCLQCVHCCGILGYVEDGRLVKLEGNPASPNNRGRMCAKGQAGINQVYDPDRILYPMKRVGKRGEGKWKQISWDEALEELAGKLKELQDAGQEEYFMFHYGRSRAKWVHDAFLDVYGTKTIGNHTSICEAAKWVGQELTWGPHYDVNDVEKSKYILNFGSNPLEAHTGHNSLAQRLVNAIAQGTPLVTFDVRLSNTAARSAKWFPIKPGTDAAVLLAMANVVMQEGLYDADFINNWTNVTIDQLKEHLAQYTPEFAEKESGVPASEIRRIAIEFATNKPSTIISYRGLVAHYAGAINERCAKLLDAIVGNIDVEGGTVLKVSGKWYDPLPAGRPKAQKKLKIIDGEGIAYPTHHVSHQVFTEIKKGQNGRPKVYLTYCYNPVYANGDCQDNIDVMKDENLLPYIVSCDTSMGEGTIMADLILPDAAYLERWDPEKPESFSSIPYIQLRQPIIKPLGEARAFQDMLFDLAHRLGMEKWLPFRNSAEYMQAACDNSPGLKEAGGFAYMREHGVFIQDNKPQYKKYAKELQPEELAGTTVNPETGTIYKGEKYEGSSNYVGVMINGKAYKGFKPDKLPISGKFEVYSKLLQEKGLPPLPSYMPVPEHRNLASDELILTTYKVNVQIHSRSQNCKWLAELYHRNPAWINPQTAARFGVQTGDKVKLSSPVNSRVFEVKVTEAVVPGVIAVSHHCGHWEYGRYASGKQVFNTSDPDFRLKWWKDNGQHPNWVIPNSPDPISGQERWMDTVVRVTKAG